MVTEAFYKGDGYQAGLANLEISGTLEVWQLRGVLVSPLVYLIIDVV